MWFKKKSVLQADHHYDTEKSFDGTDWRTDGGRNTWSASQTPPSAADANKYFYLPALGWYYNGHLHVVGDQGHYWSSTDHPWISSYAYSLSFYADGQVYVGNEACTYGFSIAVGLE